MKEHKLKKGFCISDTEELLSTEAYCNTIRAGVYKGYTTKDPLTLESATIIFGTTFLEKNGLVKEEKTYRLELEPGVPGKNAMSLELVNSKGGHVSWLLNIRSDGSVYFHRSIDPKVAKEIGFELDRGGRLLKY